MTEGVELSLSEFLRRWTDLIKQLIQGMFSFRLDFPALSIAASSFTVPLATGFVTGQFVFPDWLDRRSIWFQYSVIYGYIWTAILSVVVTILTFFISLAPGQEIWFLLGLMVIPMFILAVIVGIRYNKERSKLLRKTKSGAKRRAKGEK